MTRDQLVDWFDKFFGFDFAPEWQRTKFFDWVMTQQERAQHSVERTPSEVGGAKLEFIMFDEIREANAALPHEEWCGSRNGFHFCDCSAQNPHSG